MRRGRGSGLCRLPEAALSPDDHHLSCTSVTDYGDGRAREVMVVHRTTGATGVWELVMVRSV